MGWIMLGYLIYVLPWRGPYEKVNVAVSYGGHLLMKVPVIAQGPGDLI
jgi:hypothetical protein